MKLQSKIGVLFLAGESWWEAGCCDATEGLYAGFIQTVAQDVATVIAALRQEFTVVTSGLVHTVAEALAEARRFDEADVDAIIFCPMIWTNDPPVIAFVENARRVPLLLWSYSPYVGLLQDYTIPAWLRSSGPVSVQQSANIFRRYGWDYETAFGNESEPAAMDVLRDFARATAVKRSLRGTRIALLPAPCRVVVSTWVDEFFLRETFGVEIEYVSVDTYAALVRAVPDAEARAYVDDLKTRYPVVGVTEDELLQSARQALAFVCLAEERNLSGIALEDFDTTLCRALGFRPHLTHPRLSELGCTVGMEADVLGILSTLVLGRLAGRMGMFNEFFSIDRYENTVLMGHPGHGELSFGEPGTYHITRDLEIDPSRPAGTWVSYRAKPGPMTFLNFTPARGALKSVVFTGESLPGPRMMEGYSHMLIRPDGNADTLFRRIMELGLIQHWGTVHSHVAARLRMLARLLGLNLVEL